MPFIIWWPQPTCTHAQACNQPSTLPPPKDHSLRTSVRSAVKYTALKSFLACESPVILNAAYLLKSLTHSAHDCLLLCKFSFHVNQILKFFPDLNTKSWIKKLVNSINSNCSLLGVTGGCALFSLFFTKREGIFKSHRPSIFGVETVAPDYGWVIRLEKSVEGLQRHQWHK